MTTIEIPETRIRVWTVDELLARRAEIHAEVERRAMTLEEAWDMYEQYRLPKSSFRLMDELSDVNWLLSGSGL